MSDSFKRRRKRTGPSATRSAGVRLVPGEAAAPARFGPAEIAAGIGVSLVAAALIALIWILTSRTVQEQRTEMRERAEHTLTGQAATIAETITKELLMIDQSLAIIQAQWKLDSDQVDLTKLQQNLPALTAVANDLFIADDKHIIRQDILPQAVGQGVGSIYVTFPHGDLEQLRSDGTENSESLLLQREASAPVEAREFLMYIVRPLDHPAGWLIGASYRSEELTKLFAGAALGFNPVVALLDTRHGNVQALVGPAARRPKIDLSKTELYAMMSRTPSGIWAGQTGIDGVQRLHAFHQVPNRDMAVLVGASMAEVMAPADGLASGARTLAAAGTALVVAIGAILLWGIASIQGNRRKQRTFERNRKELERLRTEEAANTARAQINAARLQVLLDSTADGVALFDGNIRLVQWNHPFLRGIGVELRQNTPLDSLLRDQVTDGLAGNIQDTEIEVARRMGILRTGDHAGVIIPGPEGETLVLRGLPVAEGGLMLLLGGLASWQPAPPPAASSEMDKPVPIAAPDVTASAPVEW